MIQVYKTRQREALLELLRSHKDKSFTARELSAMLKEDGIAIGDATVYRTLDTLTMSGAISKSRPEHSKSAAYQYNSKSAECAHHLHLKCSDCGVLYHAECHELDRIIVHLQEEHGFSVSQADTILYGTCNACKKAK